MTSRDELTFFKERVMYLLTINNPEEQCKMGRLIAQSLNEWHEQWVPILLHEPSLQHSTSNPMMATVTVSNSLLEDFLLFCMIKKFAKGMMLTTAFKKEIDAFPSFMLQWGNGTAGSEDGYINDILIQIREADWDDESISSIAHVIECLQEPRVRRDVFRFVFDLIQYSIRMKAAGFHELERLAVASNYPQKIALPQSSTVREPKFYLECCRLLMLGITDLWSAVRKECAKAATDIILQLPGMEPIDSFLDQLLRIAMGTLSMNHKITHTTEWTEREGALLAMLCFLRAIEKTECQQLTNLKSSGTTVVNDIRGAFGGDQRPIVYHLGSFHRSLKHLPRPLVQSLKSVLYQCLKHDQLTLREYAAQCFVAYVDLCEESTQLLIFQEVMSKLNKMKDNDAQVELLDAFEAEGLLDVLAKLAPCLPSTFLVKHWKFIFPTLERYVMHIASSVRQKSSGVVLSLAKLSLQRQSDRHFHAALELLVQILLSMSRKRDEGDDVRFCWQQREGRLLGIDLLVNLLGKDLLYRDYGSEMLNISDSGRNERRKCKGSTEYLWAHNQIQHASWTMDDEELEDLLKLDHTPNELREGKSLVHAGSKWIATTQTIEPSGNQYLFWQRVLSGWLEQTRVGFLSNQFELRRISAQVLPGIMRLYIWLDQLEFLCVNELENNLYEPKWRWSCIKFLLLHLRFVEEYAATTKSNVDPSTQAKIASGQQHVWNTVLFIGNERQPTSAADAETTVVQVEAMIMGFLSCFSSQAPEKSTTLLDEALKIVHQHLQPDVQITTIGKSSDASDSSIDRQLSISLVRMLPAVAAALRTLQPSLCSSAVGSMQTDDSSNKLRWLMLERVLLAWLATNDMFRWITVSKSEAQSQLRRSLSILLTFVPDDMTDDEEMGEMLFISKYLEAGVSTNSRYRLMDTEYESVLELNVLMWKMRYEKQREGDYFVSKIIELVGNQNNGGANEDQTENIEVTEPSTWDDWDDQDGVNDDPIDVADKLHTIRQGAAVNDTLIYEQESDKGTTHAISVLDHEQLKSLHSAIGGALGTDQFSAAIDFLQQQIQRLLLSR